MHSLGPTEAYLAKDGQAPQIFARALENGNPIWAVGISALFICLGFMNASKSASTVFGYFVSLVTIFAVLNWIAILISYIHFRRAIKAQGISLQDLPYVGTLQPYGAYYALFVSCLIILFSGYDAFIPHFKPDIFVLKYLGTALFVFNVIWWKIYKTTSYLAPENVDLLTGRREFEEMESPNDQSWKSGVFGRITARSTAK
ncbi:hypothetical protein KAF25_010430 [Fusarium avenaceum]|uniref:Amino acid permease/ SLC12A domain-containing protein n=1 Tax=Fusarium avenaceum TaxID=40199 RepID=A0A9P7GVQ2_9HYPO|nr:hypothetical protein KAF25_010430 [Fusarium avenaceum]